MIAAVPETDGRKDEQEVDRRLVPAADLPLPVLQPHCTLHSLGLKQRFPERLLTIPV